MLPTLLGWGLLADRVGERAVIVAGLAGAGPAPGRGRDDEGFASLAVLLALAGALGASVNAASGRAVMGWFGPEERGLALGIRQTAIPIGGAVSAAALPWLASSGGTRPAFLALAGGCLAGAAVGGLLLRDASAPGGAGRPPARPAAPRPDDVAARRRLGSLPRRARSRSRATSSSSSTSTAASRRTPPPAVLAGINVLGIGARIGAGRWSDRLGARIRPIRGIGLAPRLRHGGASQRSSTRRSPCSCRRCSSPACSASPGTASPSPPPRRRRATPAAARRSASSRRSSACSSRASRRRFAAVVGRDLAGGRRSRLAARRPAARRARARARARA